jgi:osmotically-inducible protein OsmY
MAPRATAPGDGIVTMQPPAIGNQGDGAAATTYRMTSMSCQVYDRLRRSGYSDLRDLACDVHNGIAILEGTLRSHHLKQIAQAIACGVDGIGSVENRIEVISPRDYRGITA